MTIATATVTWVTVSETPNARRKPASPMTVLKLSSEPPKGQEGRRRRLRDVGQEGGVGHPVDEKRPPEGDGDSEGGPQSLPPHGRPGPAQSSEYPIHRKVVDGVLTRLGRGPGQRAVAWREERG